MCLFGTSVECKRSASGIGIPISHSPVPPWVQIAGKIQTHALAFGNITVLALSCYIVDEMAEKQGNYWYIYNIVSIPVTHLHSMSNPRAGYPTEKLNKKIFAMKFVHVL